MIGDTIEQRQKPGMGWAIWLLLAGALTALNFVAEHGHLIRLALAPFGIGLVCLATRRRPFSMQVLDDGLQVAAPSRQYIAFEQMEALCRHDEDGSEECFRFDIVHANGMLTVPGGLNVSSRELWDFLHDRLPAEEHCHVPSALRSFQSEQLEAFGHDRVWSFRAVPQAASNRSWFGVLLSLVTMVVGICWAASGADSEKHNDWTAIGAVTIMVGFVALLVTACVNDSRRRRRGSQTGIGGLVISPTGFALQQGDLRGMMRWDEITDIAFRRNSQTIVVRFAGGSLAIKDMFNATLRRIHGLLSEYWKGPSDEDDD